MDPMGNIFAPENGWDWKTRMFPFGKVSIFRCDLLVSGRVSCLGFVHFSNYIPPKRLKDGRVTEATCFVDPKKHHHPSQRSAPVGTSTYQKSGIATCIQQLINFARGRLDYVMGFKSPALEAMKMMKVHLLQVIFT